jgi:hypothetical protein
MQRHRLPAGSPPPPPMPSWIMGALIGMTIMTIATGAIGVGAGIALTTKALDPK